MAHPTDELIAAQTERGLTARLLAPQPTAQLAHLVALGAVVTLLWRNVPSGPLAAWAAAVVLAIAARAGVVASAGRHRPGFDSLRRRVRLAMGTTGLAWGLGAAALLRDMPPTSAVLVLAVLGTLVAGAASTLVADSLSFRLYAVCMLLPQAVAMLLVAHDRSYVVAAFLVAVGTGFMVRMNTEAHGALVEHLRTAATLQDALANVRTLKGLLPMCAGCKKIRSDQGYWHQMEESVREHAEAEFSHDLCPDCVRRLYPELSSDQT